MWTPAGGRAPDDRSSGASSTSCATRAGATSQGYDELFDVVGRRPRGLLGLALGLLRGARAHAVRARARRARDAGRRVVRGRDGSTTPSTCSGADEDPARVAVLARSQTRAPARADLRRPARAGRARRAPGCSGSGVGPGDRVVAYLPNIPETLVAFLATASLGAVWATCAPEFGPRSVIDRFGIVEPKVLLAVAGYRYGDKRDRPARRGGRDPRRAARRSSTSCTCPTPAATDDALPGRGRVGRPARRAGPLEFDPVAVRPPALRAVLVRHDRAAEGDRPRPRRHPRRALQEPRPELGPPAAATG